MSFSVSFAPRPKQLDSQALTVCPVPCAIRQGNLNTMAIADFLDDGQAEPGALFASAAPTVEAFEDAGALVRWYARAVVRHAHARPTFAQVDPHGDTAAARR